MVDTRIHLQLQQLLGFGHGLGLQNGGHADVQSHKLFKGDGVLGGLHVDLLGFAGGQLGALGLDHFFVHFLEQDGQLIDGLTGLQQYATGLVPWGAQVQRFADLGAGVGQEGLQQHRTVGRNLQGGVHDGFDALGIGLLELPRFGVGQVAVAEAGHVHGFELGFAEAVALDEVGDFFRGCGQLVQGSLIFRLQGIWGGHLAAVVLVGEHHRAVHEVA